MKKKSITKNTIVYVIKVLAAMIFPFITFPYITRILSPEGVGKYNFATSVVSYFALLAGLGVSTYAIREGARIREQRERFNSFAAEIFSINILSTIIAYLLLLVAIVWVPKLNNYFSVIFILSFSIPLITIGTEWICIVYEDYSFITIRTILFQLLSIILMLICVKDRDDVGIYALITVIASAGANITNFRYVRKYFKHTFTLKKSMFIHLKPIFILFSSTIASQIYVNSDTVMLGFFKNDYAVGIYSAATKIYNLMRTVLASFVTVLVPRVTYLYAKENKDEYRNILGNTFNGFFAVTCPIAIGMLCIGDDIIELICGSEYSDAIVSLQILALSLVFSVMGSFIANEILIVGAGEKNILTATVVGACTNILGNCVAIPLWSYKGAAMTTLISEVLVFGIQLFYSMKVTNIPNSRSNGIKAAVASLSIFVTCNAVKFFNVGLISRIVINFCLAGVIYVGVLVLMKHEIVNIVLFKLKKRTGK